MAPARTWKRLAVAAAMLSMCAATAAHADPIPACVTAPCIDFGNVRQPGGTISYDGSGGPLIGMDIPILALNGIGTPANSTPPGYPIVGGLLNFTTGAFVGSNPLEGYEFGGGGSFRITGAVPAAGLDDPATVLLDGTFTGALFSIGPPGQFVVRPRGTDLKHTDLLAFFGFAPGTPMSFGGFIITDPPENGLNGGAFSVTALNTDITNSPVPEPASLLLVGSGVAALIGRQRTRRRKG